MSRRDRVTTARNLTLLAGVSLVALACGSKSHVSKDDAELKRRCDAILLAQPAWNESPSRSFEAMVRSDPPSGDAEATGGALLLLGDAQQVDFGSWGPATRYLIQTARHGTLDEGPPAERTAEVVTSAKRIDADLAAGRCGRVPSTTS